MRRKTVGVVAILIFNAFMFVTASAATTPEDAIKYRQAVMESLGGHVAAFLLIALNKVDAREYLQNHADALANLSTEMDGLFPAGSGEGDTEALPAIWDDNEKFAAAVAKMQEATSALQETVRSGDPKAIMGAFAEAGKSCKGCHETFRAEDDDSDSH